MAASVRTRHPHRTVAAAPLAAPTPTPQSPKDHAHTLNRFSKFGRARRLHDYQRLVGGHILRSIASNLGITFTVMMARQMGKNELSAHLEAHLLVQHARTGGSIVKAAPTFRPQVTTSLMRLEQL